MFASLWCRFKGTILFWSWSTVSAIPTGIFGVPKCVGTLSVVPSVLLSCQVEILAIGLWNLMSANVGVDHSPDLELNAMVATADAYTKLVLL